MEDVALCDYFWSSIKPSLSAILTQFNVGEYSVIIPVGVSIVWDGVWWEVENKKKKVTEGWTERRKDILVNQRNELGEGRCK